MSTAFVVLAFHANGSNIKEGPYAKNIEKPVEYFLKIVPKNEHQRENSLTKGLKMPLHNWETAFVVLAMAETDAHQPDDKHKQFIVWLIDLTCKNQSGGGWGHLSLRYNIKADVTMYGSFISPTQWKMAALGILRNMGFAVPDDVLKRGVLFLRSGIWRTSGAMYYGSTTCKTDTESGRPALMIWALERVGAQDDIAYPQLIFCSEHEENAVQPCRDNSAPAQRRGGGESPRRTRQIPILENVARHDVCAARSRRLLHQPPTQRRAMVRGTDVGRQPQRRGVSVDFPVGQSAPQNVAQSSHQTIPRRKQTRIDRTPFSRCLVSRAFRRERVACATCNSRGENGAAARSSNSSAYSFHPKSDASRRGVSGYEHRRRARRRHRR